MTPLLEVRDLKVHFPVRRGILARTVDWVRAVDGVSFDLRRGETLGLVGESGSGKTTVVRTIAGLVRPTSGTVRLDGRMAMVFQDPLGSLNPRMTVRATLGEAVRLAGGGDPLALLERVGLDATALDKYPHAFSGGQRQRICIARAIAARPDLLVCDEAVSALDLSVRAQILDLILELRRELDLAVLFITHDLGVVAYVAERILVMRRGLVVESGTTADVLRHPREGYTEQLVASVPSLPTAKD